MKKEYLSVAEANNQIEDEEAVFTTLQINSDKSITAEVEVFLYFRGKVYSAIRKIRLKAQKEE